jgi:peptidoglycan/LPS O-acetylase OafA/YrhL
MGSPHSTASALRRSAAFAILLAFAGCQSYRQSVTTAKVGGVALIAAAAVIGGGVIAARTNAPEHDDSGIGIVMVALGIPLIIVGGMLVGGGLVGMLAHDKPPPPP